MPRGGGKANRLFGGQSSTSLICAAPFTVKKISQGWGWGNGGGKATAVMPHGGGKGHWSMDNSPTPPQVGGGGGGGGVGLIIDRCISCGYVCLAAIGQPWRWLPMFCIGIWVIPMYSGLAHSLTITQGQ